MGWREDKRAGRRAVHQTVQVPALYLVEGKDPLPVDVRLHVKFPDSKPIVDGAAAMLDDQPRIVFLRNQVAKPSREAIVSVEEGEAYVIGAVRPPDDEYIVAEVATLSAAKAEGLPVP